MHRILIIDDDEGVLSVFAKIFRQEGYEVELAEDGKMGIEKLLAYPADVVITDIIMPNMEGLETIGKIKEARPESRIIAISGGGFNPAEPYLRNAILLGADSTMKKPCKIRELLAEVQRLVASPAGS